MNFVKEVSNLLTNKYFLYFMVFLAATTVLGYLVTNKINGVIFFALICIITYQFSKNMAVVLLVAIIVTNLLMVNKRMREGLENETDASSNTTSPSQALNTIDDKDPQIANAIPAIKKAKTNQEANNVTDVTDDKMSLPNNIVDMNNTDLNMKKNDEEIEGFGEKMSGKKGVKSESVGPRLDYAATIEQSYANLDNLLGSDSIKQLSTDTQQLMKQQQNLFDTTQNMVPVLQGAQNMLKDFNINDLTSSLKGMGGLANAPIAFDKKNKPSS